MQQNEQNNMLTNSKISRLQAWKIIHNAETQITWQPDKILWSDEEGTVLEQSLEMEKSWGGF